MAEQPISSRQCCLLLKGCSVVIFLQPRKCALGAAIFIPGGEQKLLMELFYGNERLECHFHAGRRAKMENNESMSGYFHAWAASKSLPADVLFFDKDRRHSSAVFLCSIKLTSQVQLRQTSFQNMYKCIIVLLENHSL
ncbi:hypothetical protein SAMN05192569_102011 [Parageobacillus thermantarcticus]|uniref:Uncharacterized protein n=1 Tax=Parageobacillus thermantarcticus TaxID=186116 RepID=A0A1I0TBF8_9BACL|nr:hypothetical protein SAMN05192569_102011 [Parageobacillus thermantarcticus]